MSTIINFSLNELRKLSNDRTSCIEEKRITQTLALQPWCLGNLKESMKNLLDYKIGKYDKELNGILLSYKNLQVLQSAGVIRNENADVHFQVQADYFIFRPHVGAILKGTVNIKSSTHLGLLVHRVFNVVVPRPTEKPGGKWIGESVGEGQKVTFRIVVLDLFGALPYIRGELDEESLVLNSEEEDELNDHTFDSVNVSHIDFDKTKPKNYHHDEIDGQILSPSSKTKTKKKNKHSEDNNGIATPNDSMELEETKTEKKRKRKKESDESDSSVKQNKKHKSRKSAG